MGHMFKEEHSLSFPLPTHTCTWTHKYITLLLEPLFLLLTLHFNERGDYPNVWRLGHKCGVHTLRICAMGQEEEGGVRCVTMATDSQWKPSGINLVSNPLSVKWGKEGGRFWGVFEEFFGVCKISGGGQHTPQRHSTVLTHTQPSSSLSPPYLSSFNFPLSFSLSPILSFLSWAEGWSGKWRVITS